MVLTCRELVVRFVEKLEARDWESWESWAATMHPEVVYEVPQTRERIRGRDAYLRFNREFPGDWHLTPRRVHADDSGGVVWFEWRSGDEPPSDGIVFLTCVDGLVTAVTDFWPEPYDPPPGRDHLVERW